ncbi:mucin-2-like isoform X2 [Xyrauchen texanus]|uniref:mucin-2-like isoform X2 n=1 Tax=Xyrauchen texanus TaxID=154827 RepID=UPI00224292C3|nr:mucin-2-like isoform X2 [Xyrauchen texanus]
MSMTHRLFVLIVLVSTSGPTSIPSWSTATVFPSNVTTPVIPTHGGNVTSIPFSTQSNVTSSSTISPENATISSVSTPGNASIPPLTTSGHATPTPTTVTTAANTSSPPVSTPGNVTNHPVTAPGTATNPPVNTGSATTSFPVPVNSTTSFLTTRGNTTSPPFSTLGNTTATISTPGSATTAPQITGGNSTITAGNATTTPSNATTAPITTLSNGTFPPLTTHVSILTTLGNATVPPVTTTGNSTMSALTTPGNFTAPPQPSQGPTSIPFWSTATVFPSNVTTPVIPTHGGNVTSIPFSTQSNVTSSSTISPGNATISSVSTPGNASIPPLTTSGHATPPPTTVITAANTTSPPVSTPGNVTNHPVTAPGTATNPPVTTGSATTSFPVPVNSTTSFLTTRATCPAVPCSPLSVCVNSTCQCLAGTYLLNNSCVETKTFPSTLRVNRTFENAMKNPQSHEFRQTANEIISAVNIALHNQPNYISSTVLRLMPGSVVASVNSFFELNSQATQDSVIAAMDTAIKECKDCGILANATYMKTDLCQQEPSPCDLDTTECAFREGLAECPCKMGHVPSPYQRKSCTVCPSGKKAQGEKCVPCPFGYSGFNCDDSTLIALVVVACVLGGVLLIVILAVLIYLCVTHRWKKSKEHVYNTPNPAEEFTSTWSSPGIISIPRATVSASNDANDTTLEMTEGAGKRNSHSNGLAGSYDLATDGLRTFKGEYPSRYSYLVGHENPYFLAEDKKRTT